MERHQKRLDTNISRPSEYLSVNKGSSYVSKETKMNIEATGTILQEERIERPGSFGIVERYHPPLSSAFNKLREALPK